MKLVTYAHRGVQRVGLLEGENVIDVNRAYAALLAQRAGVRAGAMADALVPPEMIGILEAGEGALAGIREAAGYIRQGIGSSEQAEGLRRDGVVFTLSEVTLKAPIPRPGKLILLGLNYRDHAAETGQKIPEVPTLFAKYSNSVVGPAAAILIPRVTDQIDYEAEFAFVIGRRGHSIPQECALDYVAGYTIVNDVSARDYQFVTSQWMVGKTFDTHCPMGPALVLKEEIPDPHDLDICLSIAGEVLQKSNTNQLIFKIPETVEYLSQVMTLEPGDVISTGTPAGVGFTRKPPRWLRPGETVRIDIAGLGVLENPVAKAL
ncbi:MAG TPA: fumarylacetoacetate hydrolase family protein [Candidatus Tectomicrobia bacterium]|nr:fumarylacetoacetate hydrolase family protein [Candidatus Tectomicrobia bacterium]